MCVTNDHRKTYFSCILFISKLRKRQSSALSTPDAEVASECQHTDPGNASIAQLSKEVQVKRLNFDIL